MTGLYAFLAFALICLFSGCTWNPGAETPITREVMQAGGGDPASVSRDAMQQWFFQHRPFARHIAQQCSSLPTPPLGWLDTTEGIVCSVATYVKGWEKAYAGRDHVGL